MSRSFSFYFIFFQKFFCANVWKSNTVGPTESSNVLIFLFLTKKATKKCNRLFQNLWEQFLTLPDLEAYIPTSYSWKAKNCYFFFVSCSAKHLFDILKGKRVIQWAFFGSFEQQKKIRNVQHRHPVVLQKKLTDNANRALSVSFFLQNYGVSYSSSFLWRWSLNQKNGEGRKNILKK